MGVRIRNRERTNIYVQSDSSAVSAGMCELLFLTIPEKDPFGEERERDRCIFTIVVIDEVFVLRIRSVFSSTRWFVFDGDYVPVTRKNPFSLAPRRHEGLGFGFKGILEFDEPMPYGSISVFAVLKEMNRLMGNYVKIALTNNMEPIP